MSKSDNEHLVSDFIIGTQYYRPPTPTPSEWEEDLKSIKAAGFNTIKIWMMWRWHERNKGEFTWDDSDRLFELCGRTGLRININLMLDAAPDWLYDEYHCHRINHKGENVRPIALGSVYIGGVTPCYDIPSVRSEAERFLRAAVNRYKNQDVLLGWDVWNEPRYLTLSRIAMPENRDLECWCGHSIHSYRKWLKDRYETVENLNDSLGKAWSNWDTVLPPTRYSDYTEMLLWRQWCMFSITDQIRWAYHTVKSANEAKPAFCHVGACSVVQGAASDPSDDYSNSREVDFYGSSMACNENGWSAAIICDWIRSISPYYWINEIYTSMPHWRNKITGKDLRRWTWTAVAHGAKGLLYWQYKAERLGDESYGYGLVGIDSSPTDRLTAVAQTAAVINKRSDLFRLLQPVPAEVAILYDTQTDIISNIEKICGTGDYEYKKGIDGTYAMFWQNDIPVDWLSSQNMTLDKIARYKLIYLPVPMILADELTPVLKEFVHCGGVLVSEASPGLREENGWVRARVPQAALQELFGCCEYSRYQDAQPVKMDINLAGVRFQVETDRIMSRIRTSTAESIGTWSDGSCAAAMHRYGQGLALLIGTYVGGAYRSLKNNQIKQLVKELALMAGCKSPVTLDGVRDSVSVRCMTCDQARLIAVINHGSQDEKLKIHINDDVFIGYAAADWHELFTSQGRFTSQGPILELDIPAGDVMCLVCENPDNTSRFIGNCDIHEQNRV